jgi:hypothetical protein
MDDYNCFLVDRGDSSDEIVAVVPGVEVVSIAGVVPDSDVALA